MAIGKSKEFTFFAYWLPNKQDIELRQIGSLRPPNELIQKALSVLSNQDLQYEDVSDSEPVLIGKITLSFVYIPGEPEKNTLNTDNVRFNEKMEVESGTLVGDEVTGEYERRNSDGSLVYSDNINDLYAPYQDKGWLTLNGDYYTPSDTKPDGWSS